MTQFVILVSKQQTYKRIQQRIGRNLVQQMLLKDSRKKANRKKTN